LLEFIKKIKDKEKGKASDDALKLIVKISEGSVRDALSLLDRGLLATDQKKELDLELAHKIFGYFDKSKLINIIEQILQGEEKKVIENYRKIYDQGVEPRVFINDFLEIIYYLKNIDLLTLESTNFSLNDEEFLKIKEITKAIDHQILILYWQFTIKTLDELDIVSNQNLAIEMFLMRLIYLSSSNSRDESEKKKDLRNTIENKKKLAEFKTDPIDQIKNVTQEKKNRPEIQTKTKAEEKILINSLDQLLIICTKNKEVKLKYELEKNVNLVSFEKNRIEISFNDNLDKNFVKDLSLKLMEWTGERWIISFSKTKGDISIKDREQNKKKEMIERARDSEIYLKVLDKFPDANLFAVNSKEEQKE
jgi:DNA polymerase-3 subunit gamma/tau